MCVCVCVTVVFAGANERLLACVCCVHSARNDINLVMQEVGRFMHGEPEDLSESKGDVRARPLSRERVEEIPMTRTNVGDLNRALRGRLVSGLGQRCFDRLYTLLRRRAETGDSTTKAEILSIVDGDKKKLPLCYEVEVLIWQEDNYKGGGHHK